ncbi:HNH endonuclease [Hydrogenophaga sp. NFH-34]|uniref:HNH endonuclease n=1 Tax=Hydrogenophaga sp. NFH-34 TaxID=2744446 RepID=UPI003FA3AB51
MSNRIARFRLRAYKRQNCRCCYCGLPLVPASALSSFANKLGISLSRAQALMCTAEHLEARCDGGTDIESNIAAACSTCNQRRHRMRPAPSPDAYRTIVQVQMQNGCWHRWVLLRATGHLPAEKVQQQLTWRAEAH